MLNIPASDARHLHLLLADAASGTPRQWWHLEIAARLPKGACSLRGRLLGRLLRSFGPGWLLPWLTMPGLLPYRFDATAPLAQRARFGALLALCLIAGLLGLGSLNASRQLVLILWALLGAAYFGARASWQARQVVDALRAQHAAKASELAPSEAALGLAGLLVAAGRDFAHAQAEAAELAAAPDSISAEQLDALGLRAPPYSQARRQGWRCAFAHLGAVAAVGWGCWAISGYGQLLPAVLGLLLVHFVLSGHQPGWWRATLRPLLQAAACLGLAWVLAWLY